MSTSTANARRRSSKLKDSMAQMQDGGAPRPPAPPAAQQTPSLTELLDHWGSYPFAKAAVPPYAIRVVKLNKGVDGWGLQLEPEPLSIPPHGKCAIISGCVKGWLADAGGEINDGDALLKVKGEDVTNKSIDEIAGILGKAASPLIAQLLSRVDVRSLQGENSQLHAGTPLQMKALVQAERKSSGASMSKEWKPRSLTLRPREIELSKPPSSKTGGKEVSHEKIALDMHVSVGRLADVHNGFFVRRTVKGDRKELRLRVEDESECEGWVRAIQQNMPAGAVRAMLDAHIKAASAMAGSRGVAVRDRKKMLKTVPQSFVAAEAVQWLQFHEFAASAAEGTALCQRMLDAELINNPLSSKKGASFGNDKTLFVFEHAKIEEHQRQGGSGGFGMFGGGANPMGTPGMQGSPLAGAGAAMGGGRGHSGSEGRDMRTASGVNPLIAGASAAGAPAFSDALVEPHRVRRYQVARDAETGGLGFLLERVVKKGAAGIDFGEQVVAVRELVGGGPTFVGESGSGAHLSPGDTVLTVGDTDVSTLKLDELEDLLRRLPDPIDIAVAEPVDLTDATAAALSTDRPLFLKSTVRQQRSTGMKGHKVWKEQWLQLNGDHVELFGPPSSKTGYKPVSHGTLPLADMVARGDRGEGTGAGGVCRLPDSEVEAGFALSGSETWQLRAKNVAEADCWVAAVNHNLKVLATARSDGRG